MLPGLRIFETHDLARCNVLNRIRSDIEKRKVKSIYRYYSERCSYECNVHHLVVYLENALHTLCKVSRNDAAVLLCHESQKVRKVALQLCYKCFPRMRIPPSLQEDPSHSVREMYLLHTRHLQTSTLIGQTEDENPGVKVAAMKRLMEHAESPPLQMSVLRCMCRAVSDRNVAIRVYATEAIGMFKGLSDDVVERLLDKQTGGHEEKEICGALVYGIEDECLEVRKNTIGSVYLLATAGNIPRVFSFLADALNDDDEGLRKLCVHYLRMLAEAHVLCVEQEIVDQICGCFRERSDELKDDVVHLLSSLRYESTDVFDILALQVDRSVEAAKVFGCIRRIVSRNRRLFLSDMGKFYEHTCVAQIESSLSDSRYVARLVVLDELRRKGRGPELSKTVEDHLLFLRIMDSREPSSGCSGGSEFFRDILLQFLLEKKHGQDTERHYSRLFSGHGVSNNDSFAFIRCLYKGVVRWMGSGNDKLLRKIPHMFTNCSLDISSINDVDDIVRYVEGLDLDSIRSRRYQIDVQSNVMVRPAMPIRFSICVVLDETSPDLAVKVGTTGRPWLYFPAREKIDVCIFESNVSVIYCFIAKLLDNEEIRVSELKTVTISRIQTT